MKIQNKIMAAEVTAVYVFRAETWDEGKVFVKSTFSCQRIRKTCTGGFLASANCQPLGDASIKQSVPRPWLRRQWNRLVPQ